MASVMRAPFLSAAVAVVFLAAGLRADGPAVLGGYSSRDAAWGRVYYRPREGEDPGLLAARVSGALAEVELRLGRRRGRPFSAVLAPPGQEFARVYRALAGRTPERWVLGAAFPAEDLLLVRGDDLDPLRPRADRAHAVLAHEAAHLVLHRRPGTVLPRWFDEGAAMWAAGQAAEPDDEAFLAGLARLGALYRLDTLESELPRSHDLTALAYAQSRLLVDWARALLGPDAVGELLDRAEAGEDLRAVLEERAGRPEGGLDRAFAGWLAARRPLWEVAVRSLDLWTASSLLALLAIFLGVRRRRRALRKMEDEERAEETLPELPAGH